MTDNKLNELKITARNILAQNRLQIFNKHPFIGTIAMNLDLIPTRDPRLDTAMTDGKAIFFDIDFMSRLKPEEIQFVLGHEIWHTVMLHFARCDKRSKNLFNVAGDMEVNQILEADGFIPPEKVMFPNRTHGRYCKFNFPDNLSAEEYYDLLIKFQEEEERKNAEEKKELKDKKSEHQTNSQNDHGDERSNDFNNNESKMDEAKESKKSNKSNKKSKKSNGLEDQFDKHFDKDEDFNESLKEAIEEGSEDKYGKKEEADPEFVPQNLTNESQIREATEKVREMVIGAAQQIERSKGELPGHIKKYIDKLIEAKMPWKEILAAFITSGVGSNTNWNVPNKRFAYSGTYLPSHDGDMMRIAIGIDTSGSCQNDCEKFLSEISGIAKNFDQYELHLIQCDTEVKDYTMFDQNNPLDPENNQIEFKGFGGTNLHPIFNYMDLNDVKVDAAVIFTDGCCEKFDQNEMFDIPILWVITGKHDCKNLEVGQKIYMED